MQEILKKFQPYSNMKLVSLISWLFLVVTSLVSFERPSASIKYGRIHLYLKIFWLSLSFSLETSDELVGGFFITQIYYGIFYFLFAMLISLILISSVIIFIMILRGEEEINGMFGEMSKFHFIPILCVSALFIMGETIEFPFPESSAIYYCNVIFTLIALGTLIFIHMKTDLNSSKTLFYIIKQVTYGWLLALLVYNFFFGLYFLGDKIIKDNQIENVNYTANCSIAYTVIIGIVNLVISFILKNAIIPIANLFIYIGMTVCFFQIKEGDRINGAVEGVIDIVQMVLSLALLIILFFKFRQYIII